MTRGSPHTLSLTERMFHKSLFEEGLLKSTETRGGKLYHTVRRQIGGKRLPVLHISAESLGLVTETEQKSEPKNDDYEL